MNQNLKILLGGIALLLLLFVVWYLRVIVAYILISAVLSIVGKPIMEFLGKIKLGKKRLPDSLKAGLTLFFFIALLGGLLALVVPLVVQEARIISAIDTNQLLNNIEVPLEQFSAYLQQYNIAQDPKAATLELLRSKVGGILNVANLSDIANSIFGILGNISVAFFSISFITFFFLKEMGMAKNMVLAATPHRWSDKMAAVLTTTKQLLTRYFIGIFIQICLITFLLTSGLSILGVEYAFLIGFLAAIINIIPYLGPIIGMIVGLVVGLTAQPEIDFYTQMLPLASKMIGVFLTVQLLDNLVFQPYIFSNSVYAHPLEIFLVILIAGKIAGIPGMILAVPTYTFMRVVAQTFLSQFKLVQALTKNLQKEK